MLPVEVIGLILKLEVAGINHHLRAIDTLVLHHLLLLLMIYLHIIHGHDAILLRPGLPKIGLLPIE